MYYWRSLFYTSVPTRKPIDQRADNQAAHISQQNDESLNNDDWDDDREDIDEGEIGLGSNLLKGDVDEELAQKFQTYYQKTLKPVVFLVAPIRIRKDDENKPFEYFPFWFPLAAIPDNRTKQCEIRCDKSFHDIYVPRRFMSPQSGENDYAIESKNEGTFLFTTCERYERHYAIDVSQNTSLPQYIKAVKSAFKKMTGQDMDSYRCSDPGLNAEFNPFIHIERPADFTKKIRTLFSDNLQRDDVEIPKLLQSLILPKKKSLLHAVSIDTDEYSEAGKLHLGQMNNKYSLSRSQRKALLSWMKYEPKEDIMVVNGPPGTGKTTLIQSLIATKIVQSAIDADKPFLALCCAATHKAVTNIIDSFSDVAQNRIRFLPDLNGYVLGYSSYVSSKDNEHTQRYYHFRPESYKSHKSFCEGPMSPGTGNQPGVETDDYLNIGREAFLKHFEDGSSLDSIIPRLHEDVLYSRDRIYKGVEAVLDYLYENKTDSVLEWYSVLRKDLDNGKIMPCTIQAKEFDPSDECIEEHFQELLDVTYRYSAFVSSIRYWEARWIKEAVITDNFPSDRQEKARMLLQKAMLTPCFVTTLHSSVSLFSLIKEGDLDPLFSLADYLILDEAGQTLPEVGTAAFSFAKKALIFGDTQQLEPIHGIRPKFDIGDLFQSNIPCSKDNICQYERRSMLASSGNMVGFSQSACNILDDDSISGQRGIMLIEHRRCRKEIVEYCNKLVYKGLLNPRTMERDTYLFPPFSFIPIDGESSTPPSSISKINETEANAIVNWINEHKHSILSEYEGKYSRLEDIVAIITPFKEQERLLNSKLAGIGILTIMSEKEEKDGETCKAGDNGLSPMVVGTVHKLQGAQAPIVLFSSVYGSNDDEMKFIDSKPNMLNVAVSRAQDAFVVFGNALLYHRSVFKFYSALCKCKETKPVPSGLLKVFCNRFDSSTPFLFDSLPDYKLLESNRNFIEECTDGEKVIVDLLEEFQIRYFLHVPLLEVYKKFGNSVEESVFAENELRFIKNPNSHYDFLVSIDSSLLAIEVDGCKHDEPKQKRNDDIKNSISAKLGIEIRRLPTRDCISKDDVKQMISEFFISAIPNCYSKKKKSWEISLSMYQDGFSVAEIARARRLAINTIKMHLAKAVINQRLDVNSLFSDELLDDIVHAVKRVIQPGMTQGDIYRALDGTFDYDEIEVALAYIQGKLSLL